MLRFMGLALFLFSFLFCITTISAQSLPQSSAQLVIAVTQQLDESKQLPPLLSLLLAGYEEHTGNATVSLDQMKQKLGHYGPKLLGDCQTKVTCLTQKIRPLFPGVPYGLFVGVGGLGDTLLLNLVLVDLSQGKDIKQLNQTFNHLQDMKNKLPQVMKQLFPNFGKIRFTRLPSDAIVMVEKKTHTSPNLWRPVPANQPLSVLITASGYQSKKETLQIKPGESLELKWELERLQSPPRRLVRTPPPPRTDPNPGAKPVTQQWWFWTIIGVVAVGTGVGVTVGILSSQKQRKEGDFVAIDIPPLQP